MRGGIIARRPTGTPGQGSLLDVIAAAKAEPQPQPSRKEAVETFKDLCGRYIWWADVPPERTADSWGDKSSYVTRADNGDFLMCFFAYGRRGCFVYRCTSRPEPTKNDYYAATCAFRAEMKRWQTEKEMQERRGVK